MKKLAAIIIFAVMGWYGFQYYQQNGFPFLDGSTASRSDNSSSAGMTKCITKEGEVIYGIVPSGTVCEKIELVKGALTIVSSDYSGSTSDAATGQDNQHESRVALARSQLRSLSTGYSCSGKQYCSQMRSCEEAVFYLNNCPNTKMDSDGDGSPCERQFCGG
ncbi:excalibur calcium-binding domain-containing protein [Endozoicomonas sp.]|uniref:excalibur calcium-binding domain-containing protein n=1 Tax=Endozoicomonas sp. TaxID=1892382 RepID=UPI00383AB736